MSGSLTNFDPVTRTLTGGVYDLFTLGEEGGFIFSGAAIENNAASLILRGEGTFRHEAGTCAAASEAERLTTLDGGGSYVVNYVGKDVVLSSFEFATPASQLLNISSRSSLGVDDRVMICGFMITGAQPKRLIIRGIAPSQGPSGVWMQTPTLQLHSATTLLATNDDWRAMQEAEIEATQLAPTHDRECAIVATLPPGAYTAILQSAEGLAGRALVDVRSFATNRTAGKS